MVGQQKMEIEHHLQKQKHSLFQILQNEDIHLQDGQVQMEQPHKIL